MLCHVSSVSEGFSGDVRKEHGPVDEPDDTSAVTIFDLGAVDDGPGSWRVSGRPNGVEMAHVFAVNEDGDVAVLDVRAVGGPKASEPVVSTMKDAGNMIGVRMCHEPITRRE